MKQVNLGIIGLGYQGKIHLRNCLRLKEAKLVGVADCSEAALKFAKKLGVRDTYLNYEDLLKNKQLDAVIISLPNFLHLESSTKASEVGKAILLEKPLARNVEEGKEILSNVRKNGVRLMVGYDLRFHPVLSRIHDEIVDGFFGRMQVVEAANVSSGPFGSRNDRTGPVPVPSWWFDKEQVGGGVLLDLGSHLIDLLIWYFGEVVDVRSYLGYMFNMEIEDTATCTLRFKNGPLAIINVGWFSKDFMQSIQFFGTAKNALVRVSPSSTVGKVWEDVRKRFIHHEDDPYYSELKYFVECLQRDELPSPSGEDGLLNLQIVSAAYMNAFKFS